jgi:hypothetical protein
MDQAVGHPDAEDGYFHCFKQITESCKNLSVDEWYHVRLFAYRFLPEEIKNGVLVTPGTKADQKRFDKGFIDWLYHLAYLCYHAFYKTYCKYEDAPTYDSDCAYEILIPYRQHKSKYIQYVVVPRGTKVGDTVLCVASFTAGTIRLPSTEAMFKPVSDRIRAVGASEEPNLDSLIPIKPDDSTVKKLLENLEVNSETKSKIKDEMGDARLGYFVLKIMNEPFIRLPCYNVPLQCAYKMGHSDLGKIVESPAHLAKWEKGNRQAMQVTVKRNTLRRKLPDMDIFYALLLWPTLEGLRLTSEEKMKFLIRTCSADGIQCRYSEKSKSELFTRNINDRFKSHLGLK